MFNLLSPISTQIGYGKVGLNILKTAIETGKKISYFGIRKPAEHYLREVEPKYQPAVQEAITNAETFSGKVPSIRLFHQFDLSHHVGYPRIGFPIFELDKFNPLETNHLKQCDKLIVCSNWAKEIIDREIGVPCYVANPGVDKSIFKADDKSNSKKCVFLNIGKWEYRKGHDILFSVFQNAFPKEKYPDVELWMSCNNPFIDNSTWEKAYGVDRRIKIIPRLNSQEELAYLINRANYGVFLSRAEGWGLGMAEMLACGKHCLTTNYSAHTDFCTKDNCYLVDIDETERAVDNTWFFGQGNWAKLGENQVEQAVSHLREMYNTRESRKYSSNPTVCGGFDLIPHFTWEKTLESVLYACGY